MNQRQVYTTSFYALPQDQIECIWKQRAVQMERVTAARETAAQMGAAAKPGEQMPVLLVRLGSELFGLDMAYVSGIRPQEALTRAQQAPDWVMGVIRLRSRILSVVDLRHYLGLPPAAQPGAGAFVTVATPEQEVIFFVDEVTGAEALPVRQNLSADPIRIPEGCAAVLERRAALGDQPYIAVIDAAALLADPRLVVQEDLL